MYLSIRTHTFRCYIVTEGWDHRDDHTGANLACHQKDMVYIHIYCTHMHTYVIYIEGSYYAAQCLPPMKL